jgi:hypothetical protein
MASDPMLRRNPTIRDAIPNIVEHQSAPISIERSPTGPDEFAYRWVSSRPDDDDDDDGDGGFWWRQTRNSASSFGSLQIEGVGGSDVVSMQQPAT